MLLADRLVVFSPNPGRVIEVVTVGVDCPRDAAFRRHPRFLEVAAHVRRLLFSQELAA